MLKSHPYSKIFVTKLVFLLSSEEIDSLIDVFKCWDLISSEQMKVLGY